MVGNVNLKILSGIVPGFGGVRSTRVRGWIRRASRDAMAPRAGAPILFTGGIAASRRGVGGRSHRLLMVAPVRPPETVDRGQSPRETLSDTARRISQIEIFFFF